MIDLAKLKSDMRIIKIACGAIACFVSAVFGAGLKWQANADRIDRIEISVEALRAEVHSLVQILSKH